MHRSPGRPADSIGVHRQLAGSSFDREGKTFGELTADLRSLIETTRLRVARSVNAELVMLYREIGSRIRRDILGDAWAEYGNQIVSTLSRQLTAEYGAGFSRQNLFHMIRFVEAWPERA
jgi:hypothetical protein